MTISPRGPIHAAADCGAQIAAMRWDGCAVYLLWDLETNEPVYCGTSKTAGRLKSHLNKSDPTSRVSSHNLRNPELTAYWQSKRLGWMGVSFAMYPSEEAAKNVERALIAQYGLRRYGGKLFNQRLSG